MTPEEIPNTIEGGILAFRHFLPMSALHALGKREALKGFEHAVVKMAERRYAPPWPEEKRERFRLMWNEGVPTKDIAIEFGMSSLTAVSTRARQLGLRQTAARIARHFSGTIDPSDPATAAALNALIVTVKAKPRERKWSRRDEKMLRDLAFQGTSPLECAKILKCSPGEIEQLSERLGIFQLTRKGQSTGALATVSSDFFSARKRSPRST